MTASWFQSDATLRAILDRDLTAAERDGVPTAFERAARICRDEVAPRSMAADKYGPRLVTHDREGRRVDRIEYHPSYVEMQALAYGELGLVAMKYGRERVSQTFAFGQAYLFGQAEAGLFCPVCMTDGAARVLEKFASEEIKRALIPRLAARDLSTLATGAMFLTEKQGGSDVGQTLTVAKPAGTGYRLYGDKWFCSNVDAGVILALARPEGAGAGTRGLGLFVVEPTLSDGRRNGMLIHRIKDKLGVRSMPTGEVTFEGAEARLVGDVTGGFSYMTEMLNLSRLYNAVASAGIMRRALTEGRASVETRRAFGRAAAEHPLCMETLADLGAETAAALQLIFDGVASLGRLDAKGTDDDRRLVRILTPLMKYYTAKGAVWAASEGMELLGGNGYIEEFVTARLLRDGQVLPIWEGTTNICVLDALRAFGKGAGEVILKVIEERLRTVAHPGLQPLRRRAEVELEAVAGAMAKLGSLDAERAQHGARRLCDRLVATYQVAGALAFSERLEPRGDGGRDALVARRIFERRLAAPSDEVTPIDRARLTILLGDRSATIAEALA
jgi:alkylation response protein AidB-like acyl-CoA dehydrogenase